MTRPGRLVLLGHPVSHSLSPLFQNAALQDAGIPLVYEAIDVLPDALDESLRVLVAVRGAGNVTLPHKEAVWAWCTNRSPVATRVGAVNTFWTEDGRLVGDNTDVGGFDAAIHRAFGTPADGLRVAVLGAGGGAAAVLAAVERWPAATAVIASRNRSRAVSLAERFRRNTTVADSYESCVRGAGLVVNATPIGLRDDTMPVDPALLDPDAKVFDLVYRRTSTPWVVRARARGLPAEDGLRMLVEQGALAFHRWFGIDPDRDVMWRAVQRA
jgi:shikimate dehydrogenase